MRRAARRAFMLLGTALLLVACSSVRPSQSSINCSDRAKADALAILGSRNAVQYFHKDPSDTSVDESPTYSIDLSSGPAYLGYSLEYGRCRLAHLDARWMHRSSPLQFK